MIKIRDLCTKDTDELAAFYSRQSGQPEDSIRNRLNWLAQNPARLSDIPFGVGAYESEKVCGAMLYMPAWFSNGIRTQTCILSILFYVDASSRGAGLQLFMKFRSLAQLYPLYAATANSTSARLWSTFGASAINGSEFEYLRVCRFRPLARDFLQRALRRTSQSEPGLAPDKKKLNVTDRLRPVAEPESSLRELFSPPDGGYAWVRNLEAVRWKTHGDLQSLYQYHHGESNCVCVFRHSRRGLNSDILALEILEIWGQLDVRDYSDFLSESAHVFSPDMITFRGGTSLSRLNGFATKFRRRKFPVCAVWLMDPRGLLEGKFEFSAFAGE